jgi:hypothetical protein
MRKKLISCFMFIRNNLSFLLVIFATFSANAQVITGTKTVCASGCDYTSFQAAATALNTNGVGIGGANILVASGHIETAPTGGIVLGSSTLNTSLSATNPLIIQKNGVGSNPTIQAFTGTGTTDGILKLLGTDFVTINGLEFTENVTGVLGQIGCPAAGEIWTIELWATRFST